MNRRTPRGITLLELAIALAVLAVLGALALPNMGARLDQKRLEGAAEALLADVQEARFEAARQGRSLHVVARTGPAWCWAVATGADCACGQGSACELRSAQSKDHAGVALTEARPMTLTPQGLAGAAASTTLQSRRGARLRVEVQTLGRARICSPDAAHSRYPSC